MIKVLIMSKRLLKVIFGIIILLLLAFSIAKLTLPQQSKVDRSNAMQVAKQVVPETVIPTASPDFFTEYRLERDKIRSEKSDILRELIKSAKTENIRQDAQKQVLKIVQEKQQETDIENLIKARGFADALVFIRDNSISAVVKTTSLSREEVVQIADIISRISKVKSEDITISAKP